LNPVVATKFTTMELMLADSVAAQRFRTVLTGVFAGLALALALAGVYAVMTYVVAQRTSELGSRVALGAARRDVLRLVLGRAASLVAAGLALGVCLALATGRVLTSMLFEIKPADPLTYAGVIAAVLFAGLSAAFVPAWRAARVDPLAALRQE
jgi:putative ABC transport system permease protein